MVGLERLAVLFEDDIRVPKPSIASACWAETRLGTKQAETKTVARKANFLKRNLLSIVVIGGRMRPPNHLDASAWTRYSSLFPGLETHSSPGLISYRVPH